MDVQAISVGDQIFKTAKYFPNKLALLTEDRRITYGELNKRINRLSNALIDMGVKRGDKVAILFYNSLQFVESYLAIAKSGGVVVALNFRLAARELIYQIDFADTVMLIYGEEFKELAESMRSQLPEVKKYICDGVDLPADVLNREELMARYPDSEPDIEVMGEEGCVILYTAGTTGLPKGAYRSHYNVLWDSLGYVIGVPFTYSDISLAAPPLFHLAGWECFALPNLMVGATLILRKQFDPEEMLRIIQQDKVTKTFMVPAMSVAIWNLPNVDEYDLSSLDTFMTAAAPMPTELKRRMMRKIPHLRFIESWGMSEIGGFTACPPEYALEKEVCIGIPLIHGKSRVMDDEGKDVPQGEIGEIAVKGPAVIKEYYKAPEKTAETIIDGWFHTGDMARVDEDGFLYIVDRKKDMVLSGGENIYSAEVEDVLFRHPKVFEAAIIGLPDKKWGERVTAAVVLKPGGKATEEELIDFCRESLAGYKCPKQVIFMDEPLPRTSFGKVLKRELRDRFGGKA